MAPTRDCIADRWSANTKMKMTGKNEKRLITTRSIGSRRRGRASKSPMYRASRILDLNRSPHDLDERVFEARRFERDLALLAQAPLDNREDLFRRSRVENLRVRDHRHGDDETLAKTAGQVGCELVAVLPQA